MPGINSQLNSAIKIMETPYFIVNISVANVYGKPDFNSPVVTQALLGETCHVLDSTDKWVKIRQWDDYIGWINRGQGVLTNAPYRADVVCLDLNGSIVNEENIPLRDLTFGDRLRSETPEVVILPDGRIGNCQASLGQFRTVPTRENLVRTASRFLGSPYIWAGKSPRGFDCSGFVQTVFLSEGIQLVRDAHAQAGMPRLKDIELDSAEPGDLIFYGAESITHVSIALGDRRFIHSQGWVKIESLDSGKKDANHDLIDRVFCVKSISSYISND